MPIIHSSSVKLNRRKRLGEILVDEKIIQETDIPQILSAAKAAGKRMGDYLIDEGIVSSETITAAVARQLNVQYVENLEEYGLDPELCTKFPQPELLRKHKIIPVRRDDVNPNMVYLAMGDPLDDRARDDYAMATNYMVEIIATPPGSIQRALDRYLGSTETSRLEAQFRAERGDDFGMGTGNTVQESAETENSAIVQIVREIVAQAARHRASDIHIEALETSVRVRYRIDGVLDERMTYDIGMISAIMARIKILSGMDIAEKRKPQDGRMTQIVDNREFDIRVSILPTVFGEKCVMRLAEKKALTRDKKDLGFTPDEMRDFMNLLNNPNGILLVTGPTGSGKSTTLYTVLNELCKPEVNIITVEDPVEANVKGVNQVQVNVKAELTFASALRSILRQDPDIIMIGEIRDGETAGIAVQASITGHLVLSTLHTNSAPASMIRLMDMGTESYLLADSVIGVIAQRLVRKLCPDCKIAYQATHEECRGMKLDPYDPPIIHRPPEEGKDPSDKCNCARCGGKGYIGRTGVYEIMTMTPKLRRLVSDRAPVEELKKQAIEDGMNTLAMSARRKVLDGVTSYNELMRITYENE